ncbi:hypothetical protein U1Q18_043289, partial [Sarracenia purpurea var. burkii]
FAVAHEPETSMADGWDEPPCVSVRRHFSICATIGVEKLSVGGAEIRFVERRDDGVWFAM